MSIDKFFKREFGGTKTYIEVAAKAVSTGQLSPADLEHLHLIAGEIGMTMPQRQAADAKAIEKLMEDAMQTQFVSQDDLIRFNNAMTCLHVDPSWISPAVNAQLRRILVFQQIAAGHIPALQPDQVPLSLQPGELGHLVVPCLIKQEKVVGHQFHGGSRGVSVRICRGVHYRVGSFSGQSVPITENVVVSRGNLVLTSMRAVYLGDKLGFNAPWAKVNAVEPHNNAVRFYFTNKANASTLLYDHCDCAPLVEAICAQLLK